MKFNGRNEMEKIEMIDEIEQFRLIMQHYVAIIAGKNIGTNSWIAGETVE